MPFIKGQSGNPKGKPKGSKNKTTEQIRSAYQKVLSLKSDELEKDLQTMSQELTGR